MNATVLMYLVYLTLSVGLTVWTARTLSRNGEVFLRDVFGGEERIAEATNRLLVVGFYLANLGFVALNLQVSASVRSTQHAIEALAPKLGGVALLLGIVHFANVVVLTQVRRNRTAPVRPPAPYGVPGPHAGHWGPPAPTGPHAPAPRTP
ncbi:conserved hypothetical protein [Cellulomonas flavigena DSM 20109]|uniref:Uncharacterized protein n=1 Tax=Cellulomonas flavigena (strain ATCC 482 / DSM 20109 / BCRC 11376 / JCM 18109 / NBRC 3775 / NCIMB 8073 / NRS 134) TaxID=446466 RepID=D5UDJ4_CELFN|nr:hypothetical protein [Cellulomonas flavigena]ADG76450.1 conserved hypothetical protein [Cellulomonas flavigena DSM 20109]